MSALVTGAQNSVVFWEEKSLTRRRSAQPFPDSDYHISSLSWSARNNKLAVVPKWGDRVAVCDLQDDILTWSHLVHKDGGAFTCGCLLNNSRYLASGCGNSSVLVWDLKHKNVVRTLQGHSGAVSSVTVTSNDHLVVSGGQDGHIFLHPVSSSSKIKTVQLTKDQTSPQPISQLRVSLMEQSHLGCVSQSGEVSLWSIDSQRKLTTFSTKHSGAATDLSFTPSNKILMVSVGLDSCIRCYDLQTRKTVATIATSSPLNSVSILRDGSTLLAGGTDGQLYLYELRYLKTPKSVTQAHETAVTCIAPQNPFKTPAKRGLVKGHDSQHKGQLSPETSLFQSSDKSPSEVQRSAPQEVGRPHPPPHKDSHVLPETVTPYVTQRPAPATSVPLEVITPYSMLKQTKEEWPVKRGLPLVSAIATPASSDHGNMSSIFSPLEPQRMATPITSAGKITAAVPPTIKRELPTTVSSSTPSVQENVTIQSGRVSTTPSTVAPAPPPQLPIATPLIQSNRSTQSSASNLGAGIFSPLSHTDSLIGQSPILKANQPLMLYDSQVTSSADTASHVIRQPVSVASTSTKLQVSHAIDSQPLSEPLATSSGSDSSLKRNDSLKRTGDAITSLQKDSPLPVGYRSHDHDVPQDIRDDREETTPTPPPLASVVQTQYLEKVIKDSTEELWYSVHRDTRGLTVDVVRQFLTLQEGLAHQFAALNEKVDRLSEENRKLQELVHRYMPKH